MREAGADPEAAAAIVDKADADGGDREIRFFRGLLSGVLDPDKLDYLNRDAFFCGVPTASRTAIRPAAPGRRARATPSPSRSGAS